MLRLHFRRAGELRPHCVFSADSRCWCWGVPRAAAAVGVVATCSLPLLAWRAELGGFWQSLSVLMPGWCWGKLRDGMWATDCLHTWLLRVFPGWGRLVPLLLCLLPAGIEGPGKHWSLKALKGARKEELQDTWLVEHSIIWEHQGRLPGSLLIRWNTLNCVKKWGFQKHLNLDHGSDLGSLLTLCKSCNFP